MDDGLRNPATLYQSFIATAAQTGQFTREYPAATGWMSEGKAGLVVEQC
jgi:hypothetical protein